MNSKTSRVPGFYKLPIEERLRIVKEFAGLVDDEVELLKKTGRLGLEVADKMIENVIGTFELPYGVAVNFLVNNRDYLVPMVIEEPSVVAGASNAARWCREGGGVVSTATEQIMISQIQVVKVPSPHTAVIRILERKKEILDLANSTNDVLVKLGGGARDLEVRVLDSPVGKMLVVHLLVDVRDAMGANIVNTMAEAVAPIIEDASGGRVLLRIVSNLADRRLVKSWTRVPKDVIGGEEVVEGVVYAWALAAADPYRAATHNKGIMNGIIAVALATGQDTRALEAGAHAYAARRGRYEPLSTWEIDERGDLVGYLEVPIAVGVVGGSIKSNPLAKLSLKILGVRTARELAEVMGAVGLVQNLAALRALATEGIQRGHMKLHARQLALAAGARPEEVDAVVEEVVKSGRITLEKAQEVLDKIRSRR
ncbi:MAG: hydroxymethylglutaryl-CoA reductase, degradative [Sulfolobales archaeon]|nr:hydroxymethylglutaryl-CoA reductase, degradative [Sulfolobales archaeon]MCX8208511.1 hydroxymethylglutaryl-CoA reductase, degradative [Sulfolobales archaeon]MDW8010575.1 hydroxymethylglutaryl-CoA reductase, degradative [Sulfolobales archaeon]